MRCRVRLAAELPPGIRAEDLRDPEAWIASNHGEPIKRARRTAVWRVEVAGREVYVKRFNPYRWYRRVEAAAGQGFARRSWRSAARLARAGFATAPALAAVETWTSTGPSHAYYVTAGVEGAVPGGELWLAREGGFDLPTRRRLLRAAARELRRLHDAGFYSRDANPDNVLVRFEAGQPVRFYWIDLETIRKVRAVSPRRRLKNLVQLVGVVHERATPGDRRHLLHAYLGDGLGPFRDWVSRADALVRRKRTEYARRQSRKEGRA